MGHTDQGQTTWTLAHRLVTQTKFVYKTKEQTKQEPTLNHLEVTSLQPPCLPNQKITQPNFNLSDPQPKPLKHSNDCYTFLQQQITHRIGSPRNIPLDHMDLSHTAISSMAPPSLDTSILLPNILLTKLHATVISDSNEITPHQTPCKQNDYSSRGSPPLTPSKSIPLEPSLLAPPLNSLNTNITNPSTNITPLLPSSENTHNAETILHKQQSKPTFQREDAGK